MADDSGKFQRELAEISKAHKKLEGHLAKFEGLSSLIRYQEPVAWTEEVITITIAIIITTIIMTIMTITTIIIGNIFRVWASIIVCAKVVESYSGKVTIRCSTFL